MKKLLFSLLITLFSTNIIASHLMGGEITWECLKNGPNSGSYVFTLKVYRDCQGISINTFNSLTAHNVPGLTSIALNYASVSDLSPQCNTINGVNSQFSCGGNNIGSAGNGNGAVEEHIFRSDTIRIFGTPDVNGWHFTWDDCCRNSAITNIVNPGSTGFTLRAVMYPYTDSLGVVSPNNGNCTDSSPKFYEKPRTILEVGNGYDPTSLTNGFTYSHNAFDEEQDSIVYEWGQPLNDIGYDFLNPNSNTVPFTSPYSYNNPINGINLNSITGRTSYPANQQGNYVTCTKVSSYKCNQLVSEIYRELQIVLIPPTCNLGDTTNGNFGADTLCNVRPTVQPPFYYPNSSIPFQWDTLVHCGDTVNFDFIANDNDFYPNGNQQDLLFEVSGGQFYNYYDNIPCQNPPCATFTESSTGATPPFLTNNGSGVGYFEWITSCNHIISSCSGFTPSVYTFVIRVTDDYCPAPAIENTAQVISITVFPPCDIKSNATVTNPDCLNNNGQISVSPSGGYGPYTTYYSDLNGMPVNPDSLYAGTYLINLVDSTLCEITDTVVVIDNSFSIQTNFTSPLCFGDSLGSASVTVTGGTSPFLYSWSNSTINSSVIDSIPAGVYFIQVTDSNSCTISDTIILTQPLQLNIEDSLTNISCYGNSNGIINLFVNGGVYPYFFLWDNGDTSQNIFNLVSGNYQITVTDSNNCIIVDTLTVNQPNELYAYFNLNYVSCFGLSDGFIDGTTIGGQPPFTYLWSTGDTTLDLFNIPSDMYIFSLNDSNNCFFTDTIVVFEPSELIADISFDSTNLVSIGSGGTVPYTYDIYGPSGSLFASTSNNMGVSFSINPTLPGTYILVVTDANGCVDSSEVYIVSSNMSEIESIGNLNIYPNPSNDLFNISLDNLMKQKIIISVHNVLGELVYIKDFDPMIGDFSTSINLQDFGPSIYFIEFKSDIFLINKKIILE